MKYLARSRILTPTITGLDRKSTRLNSSHSQISYAVFCLKKKKTIDICNIVKELITIFDISHIALTIVLILVLFIASEMRTQTSLSLDKPTCLEYAHIRAA